MSGGQGWPLEGGGVQWSPDTGALRELVGAASPRRCGFPGRRWVQRTPDPGAPWQSWQHCSVRCSHIPCFFSRAAGNCSLFHPRSVDHQGTGLNWPRDTRCSSTPCSWTWGSSRPSWLGTMHPPPHHRCELGSVAEQTWEQALQLFGRLYLKQLNRAWPCALCDTLGMCRGSAKAGAGLRGWPAGRGSKNPGLPKGLDPAWKVLFVSSCFKRGTIIGGGLLLHPHFFAVQIF